MLKRISANVVLVLLLCECYICDIVPAPSNISLTCHNFQNILYWNYSEPNLQPEFIITVRSYESDIQFVVRTNQTYLDVSEYSRVVDDVYLLSVVAQVGESQSRLSEKIDFTYNEDFDSEIKCVMDFPTPNVTVLERKVKFSFYNPFSIYKVNFGQDVFTYTATYNKTTSNHECFEDQDLCTEEIDLQESIFGQCLSLHFKGTIIISTNITRECCGESMDSQTDWAFILTILACTGFAIVILILAGAVFIKNLTKPDTESNGAILPRHLDPGIADRVVHIPEQPVLSQVTSDGWTPLIESNQDFPPITSNTFEDITHIPLHHSTSTESAEEQEPDEEDAMDEDGTESFSGYDRKKFLVDMGSGDVVDAYGPR